MAKSIVGLDIGSGAIRAVEVSEATRARPTLLRIHEVKLPQGAVSRGEVLEPNTVAGAIRQLWSQGGFKSKNVVIGMGNQRVLSRDLSVSKMPLSRIRESLPFQVQDMLPVPVSDAILDFYPVSESIGENGPQINGLLIAAVKEAVLANVNAVELAGLTVVEVDLIPFALSRLVFRNAKAPGPFVQIDLGAGTTTVVITDRGVPQFVRLIPSGSDDLTQAMCVRLGISIEEATTQKHGLSLSAAPTATTVDTLTVMREVTSELLGSLRNTVTYFANARPDIVPTHIVLSGGGARLGGFADALSELTRLPVVSAEIAESFTLGRGVSAQSIVESEGAYLVALGLTLGSKS